MHFSKPERFYPNVLIAHKLVNYLQSASPNKGFVAKIYMSKTYDHVEWCFLEQIQLHMGFAKRWVAKIMDCVQTVKYFIKCKSYLTDVIYQERGLC